MGVSGVGRAGLLGRDTPGEGYSWGGVRLGRATGAVRMESTRLKDFLDPDAYFLPGLKCYNRAWHWLTRLGHQFSPDT